jgi:transcriptional regulator with XRE-family HTH domain
MTRDLNRGKRIRKAISTSKIVKAYALAAEINVSIAAVSKWQNGGEISLNNACELAVATDVSLDWLLLGRGTADFHRKPLQPTETQFMLTPGLANTAAMEAMMHSLMSIMAQNKN